PRGAALMQSWGLTDPGNVRKQNQDAYRIEQLDRGTLLCIVCDGMGGAKSGNIASTLAVEVFVEEVRRCWKPSMDQEKIDQMLRGAVKLANFTVYDQAAQFAEFDGMGTTLVAALVRGKKVTVVNVGDSRAYAIDRGGIQQITKDHSLVQLMVDRGELTPEVSKTYPGKNYITRAIGTEPMVMCDIFHRDVSRGDFLLLCSDGLSNLMDDQEILFEVVHGVNKQHCCKRLLNIAKNRGAPDNVTSILVLI
ncbi:MAG: Stp1/IreP family PP2C-type Ser/Thr phosphatase, partial [Faecousia sp.]